MKRKWEKLLLFIGLWLPNKALTGKPVRSNRGGSIKSQWKQYIHTYPIQHGATFLRITALSELSYMGSYGEVF